MRQLTFFDDIFDACYERETLAREVYEAKNPSYYDSLELAALSDAQLETCARQEQVIALRKHLAQLEKAMTRVTASKTISRANKTKLLAEVEQAQLKAKAQLKANGGR